MQEEESPMICVGSLIICYNPNVEVIPSILEPSYIDLLPLNQKCTLISCPVPRGFELCMLGILGNFKLYHVIQNRHLHVRSQLKKRQNKIPNIFYVQRPPE